MDLQWAVSALQYSQTNGNYHNTVINSGATLLVTNAGNPIAIMLESGTQSDPVNPPGGDGNTHCYNTISGAGALVIGNPNPGSAICVQQGSSTYDGFHGQWATLDM